MSRSERGTNSLTPVPTTSYDTLVYGYSALSSRRRIVPLQRPELGHADRSYDSGAAQSRPRRRRRAAIGSRGHVSRLYDPNPEVDSRAVLKPDWRLRPEGRRVSAPSHASIALDPWCVHRQIRRTRVHSFDDLSVFGAARPRSRRARGGRDEGGSVGAGKAPQDLSVSAPSFGSDRSRILQGGRLQERLSECGSSRTLLA
jgi:hypothetical protein